MRISIPHHYEIRMRKPRRRTLESGYNFAIAEVDIPEANLGDVRMVFEVASLAEPSKGSHRAFMPMINDDGSLRPARVVEIDNRLYVERCTVADLNDIPAMAIERSPFEVSPEGYYSHETIMGPRADERGNLPRVALGRDELNRKSDEGFAEIHDDQGAHSETLLALRASELRVVDGSVFVPVAEPRFLVVIEQGAGQGTDAPEPDRVKICVTESGPSHAAFRCVYGDESRRAFGLQTMSFAIDRFEQAKAYAAYLQAIVTEEAVGKGLPACEMAAWPLIGVIDKASVLFDADHGIRCAITAALSPNHLLSYSEEVLATWADLRDLGLTARHGTAATREALRAFGQAAEADPAVPDWLKTMIQIALDEHAMALETGRAWLAPSPIADTYDEAATAWQIEGWTSLPRPVARQMIARGFTPGVDRLVLAKTREGEAGSVVDFAAPKAAFIFADAASPIETAKLSGNNAALAQLEKVAALHCEHSRERYPELGGDDLAELPAL
ncbi:hypothetical protein [Bosea sp. RAC05]|uniref:hypothetical protein n=1 Tax=Bosea sp. RAC05 TaxID=1842539 RepID=UPI00083E1D30|nr:hypothetical protein [Bosea sp. RAC05]AOG02775.1 hypothetical protein BSY19_5395 [Bosea sp. RAC05]